MAINEHSDTQPTVDKDSQGTSNNITPPLEQSAKAGPFAKLKKKWKLVVTLLIVIIVGIVHLATTTVFVPRVEISKLRPLYGLGKPTKFNSPQALVDLASAELDGRVNIAKENGPVGVNDYGGVVYKLPPYTVNDGGFKNLPTEGFGISYTGDTALSKVNYAKLEKFFIANNFRQTIAVTDIKGYVTTEDIVPFLAYAAYESNDLICNIWHADISSIESAGTYVVSIGCSSQASYISATNTIKPYYDSYQKSDGIHKNLIFGTPSVKEGSDGYRWATVYQEDDNDENTGPSTNWFIGLYYQTPNSSTWNYFGRETTKSGELTACSAYTAPEIKKAFKGLECYDTTAKKNTTVQ